MHEPRSPEPGRPRPVSGGYLTSIAGGLVGAPVGALIAWASLSLSGWLEGDPHIGMANLGVMLFVLAALLLGTVAGQALGVYAGLRLASHPHAGTTAGLTFVVGGLVVGLTQGAGAIVLLFLPALARWIDRRVRSRFADADAAARLPPERGGE